MNLLCKIGWHKRTDEPLPITGSIMMFHRWVKEYCVCCGKIFKTEPIYLPPPYKLVTEAEFKELCDTELILPCAGIHLDKQMRVDYFFLVESLDASKV